MWAYQLWPLLSRTLAGMPGLSRVKRDNTAPKALLSLLHSLDICLKIQTCVKKRLYMTICINDFINRNDNIFLGKIVPIKDFFSLFWLFINFKFHYIWYFSHSLIYKISLGQWKHYYILTNKKIIFFNNKNVNRQGSHNFPCLPSM